MVVRVETRSAYAPEESGERQVWFDRDANRQHVDERSHDPLAAQVGAAGHRHPDDDVGQARVRCSVAT